jgi:hypothetical protein
MDVNTGGARTVQMTIQNATVRARATAIAPYRNVVAPVTVVASMQRGAVLVLNVNVSPVRVYVSYRLLRALTHAFFIDAHRARRRHHLHRGEKRGEKTASRSNATSSLSGDSRVSIHAPEVLVTIALVDVPSLPLRSSQMVRARLDGLVITRTSSSPSVVHRMGVDVAHDDSRRPVVVTTSVMLSDLEICEVTRPTLRALPGEALLKYPAF